MIGLTNNCFGEMLEILGTHIFCGGFYKPHRPNKMLFTYICPHANFKFDGLLRTPIFGVERFSGKFTELPSQPCCSEFYSLF